MFRVQGLGFGLGKGAAHGMRGGTHLSTPENRRAASVHAAAVIRLSEHAVVCKEEVVAGAQLAPRRQSTLRSTENRVQIRKFKKSHAQTHTRRRKGHGPVTALSTPHKVTKSPSLSWVTVRVGGPGPPAGS